MVSQAKDKELYNYVSKHNMKLQVACGFIFYTIVYAMQQIHTLPAKLCVLCCWSTVINFIGKIHLSATWFVSLLSQKTRPRDCSDKFFQVPGTLSMTDQLDNIRTNVPRQWKQNTKQKKNNT